MDRSFAQAVELTCTGCEQPFSAEVWLIVDAGERPDLVAQIQSETIHIVQCPHCGMEHPLNAPLLFHSTAEQTLLFAAQEGSTLEKDQDTARQLGQHLISTIPVEDRLPYLTTAHTVAGIEGLRRALEGEFALEGDALSIALRALMEASSPQQVRAVADEQPILRTPETLAQLHEYVDRLQAAGHVDTATALEQRIAVLQGGQRHPTLEFIQALLDAESPEQRQLLLQSRPHDVTPEVPTILEALADQAQRRHLAAVARDMLVIRDEVLGSLGRDIPVTPSA